MGATILITAIQAAIAGAANYVLQPAAGHAYRLEEIASDVVFVADLPDLSLALADATHADCIVRIDPTTVLVTGQQKGARATELYITNACWAVITNTAAGNANIGYTGKQVNVNNVRTRIVTAPNGGTVDVQPPAGEVWRVTEHGGELAQMGANNRPGVTIVLTNGVLVAAAICNETQNLKWDKDPNWYLSNLIYLQIGPIAAADCDIGLSMIREPVEAFSGITDVVGSATLDIQPAAGQEVVITEIAVQTWGNGAGVAPLGSPDVTISLYEGTNLSDLAEAGSIADSLFGNRTMAVRINNACYLRITEVSTANNEVAHCGYIEREF